MMNSSSLAEGCVILILAVLFFRYSSACLKWLRLTPDLRRCYNRLPNGSLGWPFVGETLDFQKCLMSPSPNAFVDERRSRYGDMFLTNIFGSPLIASTNPELNKFILTKEELFVPTLPRSIRMAVGKNAILMLQGERHKRMRKLFISVCSPDTLKYHASNIQHLASSLLDGCKGRKVFVADLSKEFTFFVVLRVLLGMAPGQRSQGFRSKFMELKSGLRSMPIDLPGTSYRKAVQARKALEGMMDDLIMERRKSKENHFPDLLGRLIFAHEADGGDDLTNEEITDVILSSMVAGFDSSANTLLLLVYYLGQHPELCHNLKVEHDEILKTKNIEESLTWDDYKKMKLTQITISETLRLSNPILSLHRKPVHDFEHNGRVVPAGSSMQVWLRSIHTDPTIYPQPYSFDVKRWRGKANTNNFYPFGVGPRLCVGMDLARMQLCFFVSCLVTKYSWDLVENDSPKFYPGPGMRKGLPIFLREL